MGNPLKWYKSTVNSLSSYQQDTEENTDLAAHIATCVVLLSAWHTMYELMV